MTEWMNQWCLVLPSPSSKYEVLGKLGRENLYTLQCVYQCGFHVSIILEGGSSGNTQPHVVVPSMCNQNKTQFESFLIPKWCLTDPNFFQSGSVSSPCFLGPNRCLPTMKLRYTCRVEILLEKLLTLCTMAL